MASLASTFFLPLSLHSQRTHFNSMQILRIPAIIIRYTPLSIGGSRSPKSTCPYVLCSSTSPHTPTSTKQHHADHDDNVIAEFLLNECGLSPPEVSKVIRVHSTLSRTRSTQAARKIVELLKKCGFTETQLKHTIIRNPSVLCLKAQQTKPKIEFLKTLGFTEQDLGSFISRTPRLLGMSLEKNLTTNIPYLENVFGSKENLSKAFRRSASLLIANVEENIRPKLEVLQQSGIQDKLLFHLVSRHPFILSHNSAESLKLKIDHVKKMGISEGSKTFTYALFVVTCNGPENIDKKLKHMESLGLLEDEIGQLIHKAPLVLNFSTDKLQKNMDFLTQTAGLSPSVVVKYPYLLGYSVEKRHKPRYEVFKALGANLHKQLPSLPSLLNVGEKAFLNFVERSPEAARIYKLYRHKSIT